MAWVNSQLKKRPGSRTVQDLRYDMRDGVALAQLIEVVGKYSNNISMPSLYTVQLKNLPQLVQSAHVLSLISISIVFSNISTYLAGQVS